MDPRDIKALQKHMDITAKKFAESRKLREEAQKAEKERKEQEAENKRRNETKKTL